MSIQDDIKNQLTFIANSSAIGLGVSASYYPATLTGYDVSTGERSPSETSPIRVQGYFGVTTQRGNDGVLGTATTFTIPSTAAFIPAPMDRFTAIRDGVKRSYTVVLVKMIGGATGAGYRLFVEQA